VIRVRHLLVLDFFVSGDCPRDYQINLQDANVQLGIACLKTMLEQLHFDICKLEDSRLANADIVDLPSRIKENISDALQYSSLYWSNHLCFSPHNGDRHVWSSLWRCPQDSHSWGHGRWRLVLLNLVAYPVIGTMDMLHGGLVFRVLCDLDGRFIVDRERGRARCVVAEFIEKIAHPYNLIANLRSSGILRLGAGRRDVRLETASPLGGTTANADREAPSRSTVVRVPHRSASEYVVKRSGVARRVSGPLEVLEDAFSGIPICKAGVLDEATEYTHNVRDVRAGSDG